MCNFPLFIKVTNGLNFLDTSLLPVTSLFFLMFGLIFYALLLLKRVEIEISKEERKENACPQWHLIAANTRQGTPTITNHPVLDAQSNSSHYIWNSETTLI